MKIRYKLFFKVCHSSANQTISVRLVYNKIMNYDDSILAKLNYTMQTNKNMQWKDLLGTIFVVKGSWAKNVQNLQF